MIKDIIGIFTLSSGYYCVGMLVQFLVLVLSESDLALSDL